MDMNMFYGILIPFVGTSAGAACVFFMKKDLHQWVQRCLTGFAAGVMVAASVWSLLIPAIEQAGGMGKLSFIPAAAVRISTPGAAKSGFTTFSVLYPRLACTYRLLSRY